MTLKLMNGDTDEGVGYTKLSLIIQEKYQTLFEIILNDGLGLDQEYVNDLFFLKENLINNIIMNR